MSSAVSLEQIIDGHGLTCRELVALITGYLENGLPDGERRLFETHIEICNGCRRHLEQIKLTIASTGKLREQDLPAEARDRLLAAFRSWKSEVVRDRLDPSLPGR